MAIVVFVADKADTPETPQERTAEALRRFLHGRQVEFTEIRIRGRHGPELHIVGPAGEVFVVDSDGMVLPFRGTVTPLAMAVSSAPLTAGEGNGTSEGVSGWMTGCAIAVVVLVVGFVALVILVSSQMPEMDFSGIGDAFGDPCRDELEPPKETEIPTERSTAIGWEASCPLFLWLRTVTITWYYATDESQEEVLAFTAASVRRYLETENLQSITVQETETSLEGSGVDVGPEGNSQLKVKVVFHSARPAPLRLTGTPEPPDFTTYYSVEVFASASVSATSTPDATVAATPTPAHPTFKAVSAGYTHTCGLTTEEVVRCWGSNDYGESTPPSGRFIAVSAAYGFTCALREDKTAVCWGYAGEGETRPPPGAFTMLSGSCGLRPDGTIECWGHEAGPQVPTTTGFSAISVDRHSCALRPDKSLACWLGAYFAVKSGDYGQGDPPQGAFLAVSAGGFHTCGLRGDFTVACWGRIGPPPSGGFKAVSSGSWHSCGIRTDGLVECWGDSTQPASPAGRFIAISAGGTQTCGIREDGSVECWGGNEYGQATPR